jgi:anaerobic ribonucleoside-triphosphate reductase
MENNEWRTKCQVWTRVMGYFRPKSQFNIWKRQEFEDRVYFKENSEFINKYKNDDQ